MGSGPEKSGAGGRKAAATLTAVGTMAIIALVSVTAIVAWARLGGGRPEIAAAESLQPLPETLAGGIEPGPVPDEVARAFDGPVLGARLLDELPPEVLDSCKQVSELDWDDGAPQVAYAIATPDGIQADLEGRADVPPEMGDWTGPNGEQPERFRLACNARFEGGAWISDGGGFEPIFEDQPRPGGFGSTCCDAQGLGTATGSVSVVDGATWVVQDRAGWYLAYPADGAETITVTWKYRENNFGPGGPPQSRVTFVDDAGENLGEGFAGGQF